MVKYVAYKKTKRVIFTHYIYSTYSICYLNFKVFQYLGSCHRFFKERVCGIVMSLQFDTGYTVKIRGPGCEKEVVLQNKINGP